MTQPAPFQTVLVHASFRASALQQKRVASLFDACIDHTFHYAGLRQASLWLRVHQAHAPHPVELARDSIYHSAAHALARELAGQTLHVIGLGCGGGEKESCVLQALRTAGCTLRYTPVDVSPELALMAAEAAAGLTDEPILPVVGDLDLLPALKNRLDDSRPTEQRVYTAFGLSPNFPPGHFLSGLATVLGDRDHLLLSANLAPVQEDSEADYQAGCQSIRHQYDNPETRRWLRQVLIDWGLAECLGEVYFEAGSLEGIRGFFAYADWLDAQAFDWEGLPYRAAKGERLRLFFSLRYTPNRLANTLQSHGLRLMEGQVTHCRQEGVWRVGRLTDDNGPV